MRYIISIIILVYFIVDSLDKFQNKGLLVGYLIQSLIFIIECTYFNYLRNTLIKVMRSNANYELQRIGQEFRKFNIAFNLDIICYIVYSVTGALCNGWLFNHDTPTPMNSTDLYLIIKDCTRFDDDKQKLVSYMYKAWNFLNNFL